MFLQCVLWLFESVNNWHHSIFKIANGSLFPVFKIPLEKGFIGAFYLRFVSCNGLTVPVRIAKRSSFSVHSFLSISN